MSGTLHIALLGELEVRRDGAPVALPPSKKTRALLGYLALTGRAHRRDQLCELLWDVTDDPRGALRWSLSKLRGILDDDGATRIDAGREEVGLRAHGAVIDALELRRALAPATLAGLATDEVERIARSCRGELLEGLDQPDFDTYQAWCVAQREEARHARVRLLAELGRRLAGDPARAVEHARARVQLDPGDAGARAALITILGALDRPDEARVHLERGRRLAAEAHDDAAARALDAAWAGSARAPAVASVRTATEREPPAARPPVPRGGRVARLGALDAAAWQDQVRAAGAGVAAVAALEADAGRPYGPWLDALGQLPGAAARPRPELVRRARAAGAGDELPADREGLFEEIAAVLDEVAAERPLVITIDDAHWLDAGSCALLHHVARRDGARPIVIALLARAGELDDNLGLTRALRGVRRGDALIEHALAPLDLEATAALVRAIRADADPARLHALSAGNPLFAIELARSDDADGAPPRSIATAIRDRLAGLAEEAAQILRWAAVLRRGVGLEELEALSGQPGEAVVAALEVLTRHALLARDGDGDGDGDGAHYVFRHELIRQVVYDELSEPRRRWMHRRIAQWLAARGDAAGFDVAVVAQHAAAAHDAALATSTCLAAARRSLRVFAHGDAHALARRGLRHVEALADPERTRRALELYEVSLAAASPDDPEPVARQVEALAERALDLGAMEHARLGYHLLAYLRWQRGAPRDARRHMLHAQLISRGAGEPEQIVAMAEAARCLVLLERDLPEAEALALEAAARGRVAGIEPPAMFAALGMLHLHRGQLDEAGAALERALAVARAQRDRHDEYQALEQLTLLELERGDAAAASARAAALEALGARFTDGSEAPFARGLAALARCMSGGDAAAALDAALDELARVDAKQRLSYLASRAAWCDLERGDPARAAGRARRALAAAIPLERATEIALARATLTRAGDGDGAAHVADIAARWPNIADGVRARLRELVGRDEPGRREEDEP